MTASSGKLGILVGGGPAPGINSVIAAATIRASLEKFDVIGIREGYRWIMRGNLSHTEPINIDAVSRIHFRGGSMLSTARDNPTRDPKHLEQTIQSLRSLGIDKLISIGGDDTAFSAMKLQEAAAGKVRVVHVPKTIDNDIDLPHGAHTFGYQTARHVGAGLVKNLMIDAKTTNRWYIVISMGRKAGHLALGIGKAVGATLTVIPEEFPDPQIRLPHVADIIAGAVIKRLSYGRRDGVAVLAEGLVERMDHEDLAQLATVERDEHGHIRLSDIQFGPVIQNAAQHRLEKFGITAKLTPLNIGYELRCAEPVPSDMAYTRDLGFCAAQFIINGGQGAIASIENGRFQPLYFKDMLDPETGHTRVRIVDIASEYYHIARRYMLRLNRSDFDKEEALTTLSETVGISLERFREEFGYLVENDTFYQLKEPKRDSVENVKVSF